MRFGHSITRVNPGGILMLNSKIDALGGLEAAQASNLHDKASRLQAENEELRAHLRQQHLRTPHGGGGGAGSGMMTPRSGQLVSFRGGPSAGAAAGHQQLAVHAARAAATMVGDGTSRVHILRDFARVPVPTA